MLGAVALIVGLPQQLVRFDNIGMLAPLPAAAAAAVVCGVDRDITKGEAAVASLIATSLCLGIDWRTGYITQLPVEEIAVPIAASAGIAVMLARDNALADSRTKRVLYALFVTGGVLAALVLTGIALHRATGWKLKALPWLASASSGALLAWRAPQLTLAQVVAGIYLAMVCGGLALVPAAPDEIPTIGIIFVLVLGIAAIMTGIGAVAHHLVTKRLHGRALPTARLRDKA
jgi:hypothetical protein